MVACPACKIETKLSISLLCTDVKEHIAVWYEPYPDPVVEQDVLLYAKHFGAQSFYATAPRIRDWNAFKEKIVELEQRTGIKPAGELSPEMTEKMHGFVNRLKGNKPADSTNQKDNPSPKRIWVPQIVVSLMLLWALNPENPYGYYILLRWVCFGTFLYLASRALAQEKQGLIWILGITALVYNPIFSFHLNRELWSIINLVTIGIAVATIFMLPVKIDK